MRKTFTRFLLLTAVALLTCAITTAIFALKKGILFIGAWKWEPFLMTEASIVIALTIAAYIDYLYPTPPEKDIYDVSDMD